MISGENPQRFAARVDAFEAGLLVPALDGASEVEVVVDEARDDGCALDVDDLRVRTFRVLIYEMRDATK